MTDLVSLLRGVPLLAELPEPVLRQLGARCVPRTVGADFVLFHAGDSPTGLYLVLEGRVRIYRTAPDGRQQTLTVEGPGRPVAELPLVDGRPYPASAVTAMPSRLVFLPRREFEHAFRTDPDTAAAVVRALGTRMRHLVQLIETIAFRDVAARLAMLLADYADRDGAPESDGSVRLTLERTQDELAAEIGTARESVSRAFRQLKQKQMIVSRNGKRLVVVAPDTLRDWARGSAK
jgi:CRP/FNR family transcriptional regulator